MFVCVCVCVCVCESAVSKNTPPVLKIEHFIIVCRALDLLYMVGLSSVCEAISPTYR